MKIQMNIIPILLYDKKDMLMNKICFVMNEFNPFLKFIHPSIF